MILVDDYSRNLHAWELAGHVGIKFYNGINGSHGSWKGCAIGSAMSVQEMYDVIASKDGKE